MSASVFIYGQTPTVLFQCYFNAQSAGGKSLSIAGYICDKKVDFCCMTESRIKEGDVVTENSLSPNGYLLKSNPRQGRGGGGVAIIYKSVIKPKLVTYFEKSSFECAEWLVTLSANTFRLVIIYCPPYSTAHPVTESSFLN